MTLNTTDRAFRHPGVTRLEYRQLEMDRVLTAFLARLKWDGASNVLARSRDLTVANFAAILHGSERFEGFDDDLTRRWLENHLLDLVNRDKATEAVAGLRPLHGDAYRFRNARRSRPAGADEQLYALLANANQGPQTLAFLHEFFFPKAERGTHFDVETQAVVNLAKAEEANITDRRANERQRRTDPPLDPQAADRLAEDTLKLLFHADFVPRSVLVEYLSILFAFHLALYHLRIMKLLPTWVAGADAATAVDEGGLFLDVAAVPGQGPALLAERNAAAWYGRIPDFVHATFTVKKLEEFADNRVKQGRATRPKHGYVPVPDLIALLGPRHRTQRANFGGTRYSGLLDRITEAGSGPDVNPDVRRIQELKLEDFHTYVELITLFQLDFHRRYITQGLDSLLLKHHPGAALAQPRRGRRRFVLDSRLLEVLLLTAFLREGGSRGFHTAPLRVEEFLGTLRERYGLYIDRLPPGDGFTGTHITDRAALRENSRAFLARLREIGFYSDTSDAYLTQTITPRYVVPYGTGS